MTIGTRPPAAWISGMFCIKGLRDMSCAHSLIVMSQIRISQHGGWLMVVYSNEVTRSVGFRSFRRLDCVFVGNRFIGHVGLLQNSIYNLFFQYNRTHFVHLLVVLVVPGNDLLRLLVSRSHLFDQLADAGFVRLELELLDHFSNDQAQYDAA